jgi:hypothetical protein
MFGHRRSDSEPLAEGGELADPSRFTGILADRLARPR